MTERKGWTVFEIVVGEVYGTRVIERIQGRAGPTSRRYHTRCTVCGHEADVGYSSIHKIVTAGRPCGKCRGRKPRAVRTAEPKPRAVRTAEPKPEPRGRLLVDTTDRLFQARVLYAIDPDFRARVDARVRALR